MKEYDKSIIAKLVKAMKLNTGDVVLLHFWGDDCDRKVLHDFSCEVAKLGCTPFEMQESRETNSEIFNVSKDTCFGEKFLKVFDCVDVVLDIMMYRPVVPSPKLDKEHFEIYRRYMGEMFKKLGDKYKFVQLRVPTKQMAQEEGIDEELFINTMIKAYDIDYDKLNEECNKKVESIKGKTKVIIKTANNCELTISLEGRQWFIDAGDGDLPCGEVGIAPVEDKTNGTVYYDKIYLDVDEIVEHVTITIKDGKIQKSDNDKFNEFIKELPPNGDVICELGLGMNENVTELTGNVVTDEKMINTFHLGIGMNVMFGGKNESPIHMDFVGKGEVIFN